MQSIFMLVKFSMEESVQGVILGIPGVYPGRCGEMPREK